MCCSGKSSPWLSRECLLWLRFRIKQQVNRKVRRGRSTGCTGDGGRGKEKGHRHSAAELGMSLEDWIWGTEREEKVYLVFWHGWLVSRGCLLELGAGKKQQVEGSGVEGEDL